VKPLIGDEELEAASDDRSPIVQMNPMRSTALPSEVDGKQPVTEKGGKGSGKSRCELPPGAVSSLKAWLLSPEHFTHQYPTPQDQVMLMQKTGIDKKQLENWLKNWFTNARRRLWKSMLKKQLESGKLAAMGAGGGRSCCSRSGSGPHGANAWIKRAAWIKSARYRGGMDNKHSA